MFFVSWKLNFIAAKQCEAAYNVHFKAPQRGSQAKNSTFGAIFAQVFHSAGGAVNQKTRVLCEAC
jgi:hypothetical protein